MGNTDKNSALGVLAKVPETLRSLVEENTKLASELEGYRRKALAEEIVTMMEDKGLGDPDTPFKEKVAALLSSDKDLERTKEAIEYATPNMSYATLTDKEDAASGDTFESYIAFGSDG